MAANDSGVLPAANLYDFSPSRLSVAARCGLADTDAAWLAAMVDAEGSINVIRSWRNVHGTRRSYLKVRIQVANTDRRLIQALVDKTGHGAVQGPYTNRNPRAKPSYRWCVAANACRILLPTILPWLVCKQEQAKLAIELLVLKDGMAGMRWFDDAVRSMESRARADAIYDEMAGLNAKGC